MNLPEDFIRETGLVMGEERMNRFLGAFDEEAPTSIRLNPRKISLTPHPSPLTTNMVPWCQEGFYLQGRPQFTFDPLFHAGCYYVQEAASMFVTHILRTYLSTRPSPPSLALDMCAAPGGKSTAIRSLLPEECTLISNEPIANRAQILLENITKWGYANSIVTNNYPKDFRKSRLKFDVILCDVPCSGEGMFRKDPGAISEWSMQNVEKCWRLQREIVSEAWDCLNSGGLLIYSTCTYNIKENEENIQWILDNFDAEVMNIPVDPSWQITGSLLDGFTEPVYRFIPGFTRGEGLFACALRKIDDESVAARGERFDQRKTKGLNILSPLIPTPSPLSISVDYFTALNYLRGEAITLPPDTPRGIVDIAYKGFSLGPAKNIGNRANNLYPKAWRIKTTHLPSEEIKIIDIQ